MSEDLYFNVTLCLYVPIWITILYFFCWKQRNIEYVDGILSAVLAALAAILWLPLAVISVGTIPILIIRRLPPPRA